MSVRVPAGGATGDQGGGTDKKKTKERVLVEEGLGDGGTKHKLENIIPA